MSQPWEKPDGEMSAVVVKPRDKGDAQQVNEMIKGAIDDAASAGLFDKLALCYNTRRMILEGETQSSNGLLPARSKLPKERERQVFTWEGGPDTRVPYADELVEEHRVLRESAWHRGQVRLGPRETEGGDGTQDEEKASSWQTAMDYWMDVGSSSMEYQFGLYSTCVEEYGYGMIYAGARLQVRMAKRTVTLDDVLQLLVQERLREVAGFGEEGEGALTDEVVAAVQEGSQVLLEEMLMDPDAGRLQKLLLAFDADMPKTEARVAARDLRRAVKEQPSSSAYGTTGASAVYYAPQDDGYLPFMKALVPFINGIHGTDLTGDGQCWWFGEPERLCESDLRIRAASEKWEPGFLEAVLNQPNTFLVADQSWNGRVPAWALSGAGVNQVMTATYATEPFYEVVYVWRRMVDAKGRPMVYYTLVHPKINDMAGFHECSGLADLPLHAESREKVLFAVQSRGIPEIVVATQNVIKIYMDAEGARSQLGSNPPLERGVDQSVDIEPGRQIFRKRPGNETKFLTVPAADVGSLQMMDRVRDMMDKRFFRHVETDPDMKRLYREGVALAAVKSIRAIVRLLWKVMQGKVDTLKVSRIAGRLVDLSLSRDSMEGDVDVVVDFYVDGISLDASDKMLGFATKLLGLDAGNIDRNALVEEIAKVINPAMARRFILPADKAAKRVVDEENSRIAQMVAGVTVGYDEKVSAPQLRLEVVQAWVQKPENQARMQADPLLMEGMKDEFVYLQRQIQQYQENPVTGRTLMPAS
jgi:hypothetical protein